jgi:hypothetical protein
MNYECGRFVKEAVLTSFVIYSGLNFAVLLHEDISVGGGGKGGSYRLSIRIICTSYTRSPMI